MKLGEKENRRCSARTETGSGGFLGRVPSEARAARRRKDQAVCFHGLCRGGRGRREVKSPGRLGKSPRLVSHPARPKLAPPCPGSGVYNENPASQWLGLKHLTCCERRGQSVLAFICAQSVWQGDKVADARLSSDRSLKKKKKRRSKSKPLRINVSIRCRAVD